VITPVDLNLDGRLDIVLGNRKQIEVLLNQGPFANRPPTAVVSAAARVECTAPAGANVLLDGSASSDPDSATGTADDIVAWDWFEDFALSTERPLGSGPVLTVTLAVGTHTVTLRVTDKAGLTSTAEVAVVVVDTVPPTLSPALAPLRLWPPNHRMVSINHSVSLTDACGAGVAFLAEVNSSEPDDAAGGSDGNTSGDIVLQEDAAHTLFLRAERDARGSGRVYTLTFRGSDASGNTVTATAHVLVPHDLGGVADPVSLRAQQSSSGTLISWRYLGSSDAPLNPSWYNVARGRVNRIHDAGAAISLGPLDCVEAASVDTSTLGHEDQEVPAPGEAFFYVVEFVDASSGQSSSFGHEGAAKPHQPGSGGCPQPR